MESMQHGRVHYRVVHMDFLYFDESKNGDMKYVLMIKYDLISYDWFHPGNSADKVLETIAKPRWT